MTAVLLFIDMKTIAPMKALLLFALLSCSISTASTICMDGSREINPQTVGSHFTGTVYCRDNQSQLPTENFTYRKGVLVQKYQYEGAQLRWIVEYFDSGKLKSEMSYSADGLDGPKREYLENGKLKEDSVYEKGVRRSFKEFDKNGAIKIARTYTETGENDTTEVYENGKMVRRTQHNKGEEETEQRDSEERVIAKTSKNGKKTFYPNGKLQSDIYYKNGDLVGSQHYSEAGKLDEITIYEDSHDVAEVTYHPDGSVKSLKCDPLAKDHDVLGRLCGFKGAIDVAIKNEKGQIVDQPTYLNGKVTIRRTYSEGRITGEFPGDDPNGLLEGVRKTFHPNGKLASESHYKTNTRILAKYFYENGALKEVEAADEKGHTTSTVRYDEKGEIKNLACKPDAKTLPDFKKICDF